jgi:hypothetical protein
MSGQAGQVITDDQFRLSKQDKPNDISFLNDIKLTKVQLEQVEAVKHSRELRIYALSRIQRIFNMHRPVDVQEAAARYYEAKGLMDLIPEIQK